MAIPIIGDFIDAAKDLVSEFVVDKDKRNELNVRLQELGDRANQRYHEQLMGQIETNKIEAGHSSVFVAGWRPYIGWVGGTGLAWAFVVSPFVEFVARIFGWSGTMPTVDMTVLGGLIAALLGFGGMRSWEKKVGVATNVVKPVKASKEPVNLLPASFASLPEDAPWIK